MAIATNIVRRGSTYYVRAAVPQDLISSFGKTERWKSLRTKEGADAKRLARKVLEAWDVEYEDRRRRRTLTDQDLKEAVWNRYVQLTAADEQSREELPSDDVLDAIWRALVQEFGDRDLTAWKLFELIRDRFETERRERAERLAAMRAHAGRGETKLVSGVVQDEAKRRGLELQPGSAELRKMSQALQRAEIEALTRAEERDRGEWGGAPRDPLVQPPPPREQKPVAAAGESVLDLFEVYAGENPDNITTDTLNQSRMAVALFTDTVGMRFPASRISKKEVRDWKALLARYPVKAAEIAEFRGLSMRDVVARNEKVAKPAIGPRTINRYLSSLGAFCGWLAKRGYIERSPVDGMFTKVDKTERKTLPFSTDQLNTLFRSPLFTGCASPDKLHLPGELQIRDHQYWLPLVMLYTGARPAEIAQLLVKDVRQEHGLWIVHITTEGGEGKTTKTKGSRRIVPVHSELVKLGFIAHVEQMRQRGAVRLFPEAERNQRGQMAAKFSRDFGRMLAKIGMKEGRGLSLYSLRHGFVDALRRAGLLDAEFGFLVGHAPATTTGQYGIIPQGTLQQRVEIVERVQYPGLDLSKLYLT